MVATGIGGPARALKAQQRDNARIFCLRPNSLTDIRMRKNFVLQEERWLNGTASDNDAAGGIESDPFQAHCKLCQFPRGLPPRMSIVTWVVEVQKGINILKKYLVKK